MKATIISIEPIVATDKDGKPTGAEYVNLQLASTVSKDELQQILRATKIWGVEIGINANKSREE